MDTKQETLNAIADSGVVAVIRLNAPDLLERIAGAIAAGGIRCIEFTMTTPGALQVLGRMNAHPGSSIFGAGTVLDVETARAAMLAGARFIVSPTLSEDVIGLCRRYSIPVIPGAMTPTEMLTAWEMGADLVKLFPATVLGPRYIKDVLGPLPHLKIVPTGGIDLENAGAYIAAGATAIGVGGSLLDRKALTEGRFDTLTDRALRFVSEVATARAGL